MDNLCNPSDNFISNDSMIENYSNYNNEKDDIDSYMNNRDFGLDYFSNVSDGASTFNSYDIDEFGIYGEDNLIPVSSSRSSTDDTLSLWSEDSNGINTSLDEFSLTQGSSMWDDLDSSYQSNDTASSNNNSKLSQHITEEPISNSNHGINTYCYLQSVYAPSPANLIKMTVLPSKTTVHEAIKAAGIGQYSRVNSCNNRGSTQFLIVNQSQPQFTYFQPMIVYKNEQSNVNNQEDKNYDKDMPILTPEVPISSYFNYKNKQDEYSCTKCDRVLPTKHALRKHMHLHGSPRFQCGLCNKKFFDRSKLRRHQLVHTGEKRFKCNVCEKAFTLEYNLRTHVKLHLSQSN